MNALETKISQLNKFISDFYKIRDEIIEELSPEILDFNVEQMRLGYDSENLQIGELKSPDYADAKKFKGGKAPQGWVDLHNEGDFHGLMYLDVKPGSPNSEIGSKDIKADDLQERYDDTIFWLNPENLEEIQEMAIEMLIDKFNNYGL